MPYQRVLAFKLSMQLFMYSLTSWGLFKTHIYHHKIGLRTRPNANKTPSRGEKKRYLDINTCSTSKSEKNMFMFISGEIIIIIIIF